MAEKIKKPLITDSCYNEQMEYIMLRNAVQQTGFCMRSFPKNLKDLKIRFGLKEGDNPGTNRFTVVGHAMAEIAGAGYFDCGQKKWVYGSPTLSAPPPPSAPA